jgi:ATP-dependent Zn protease
MHCILCKCCVLHAQQLDYVAKARSIGSSSGIALDRESVLTQLLAEMDGFSSKDGIVVMATTNRAVSALLSA